MDIDLKPVYATSNLKWLEKNVIYLTKYGSHAYGTSTPESDLDIRGICIPPKHVVLGILDTFEQAQFSDPYDLVIFDLRKFIKLALDFNPNAAEILFTDSEDHLLVKSPVLKLFEHRNKFISKKAKYTMSGYAISQLKRINLHRRYILNPPTKKPDRADFGLPSDRTLIPNHQLQEIEAEIEKKLSQWQVDTTGLPNDIKIDLENKVRDMLFNLKINTDDYAMYAARSLGLDDNLLEAFRKERVYRSSKKEWDNYQNWKATRNPKRYAIEEKYHYDTKHGSHLYRLYVQCRELLETGTLTVKRHDAKDILAIKNGAWTYEKLVEWAEKQEKDLNELYKTSKVPREPDRNFINNLCIEILEESLRDTD